jgi:serine/threonine-protein kinase
MKSTVLFEADAPLHPGMSGSCAGELFAQYRAIVQSPDLRWTTHYHKVRLLGKGGQGLVYLCERQDTNRFSLPVALKVFSPESYGNAEEYAEDMGRIEGIAARVALLQHDNLLDIHGFIEQDGIRIMEMEWVDGFNLEEVLTQRMLDLTQERVHPEHWEHVRNVIITAGPAQPRLKPGIAIQVLRECLAALAALHREGIVHGDVKPSNIMLKRTGSAKVIDLGSATDADRASASRHLSPAYAAPEVLRGGEKTPQSDLASLGYVLIEMLAGRSPFDGLDTYHKLIEAKADLYGRLSEMLPPEVSGNEVLLHLCRRLVASDPARRFPSALAADLDRKGAVDFHRQLVKGNLASEYENDLRVWLEKLG